MKIIAIWIGKCLIYLLRLSGRGGSALPGLVIEKVYPALIEKQLSQLSEGVIVVTGTNGKTTTTKVVSYLLGQCGLRVITNPTGSNFTRGIYATLVRYSSLNGRLPYDVAVLELDEAFSRKFSKIYTPDFTLVLNVMRDQLDRYGEIDTSAEYMRETVKTTRKGVVLNANDNRVADMASSATAKVTFFAVNEKLRLDMPNDDEMHGRMVEQKTPTADVVLNNYKPSYAVFTIGSKQYSTKLKVPGLHNAANMAAALTLALEVCPDMKPQFMVPLLGDVDSAFGRGERITRNGKEITLSLVKNPSGFQQAMKSFAHQNYDTVMFAINDEFADGRDVSWLWDVDFSGLKKGQTIITTGSRAYDMSLRLQYDDLQAANTDISLKDALASLDERTTAKAIIYCTYTAMLSLRKILSEGKGSLGDVW